MTGLRVATGGISHESNTFNPLLTELDEFKIVRGKELLSEEPARFLQTKGVDVVPTIYAEALPSGPVAKNAYVYMKKELLRRLESVDKVDGVCLFLHGAMEVEDVGDGESDLVKSVRERVGEDALISVSLDLHGNISPELVDSADILTSYRTAPHVDSLETRMRAVKLLVNCLAKNIKPVPVMVKPPVLLPGEMVVTDIEPASKLYRELEKIDESPNILNSSLLVGMAWADTPNAGASVIVVAKGRDYKEEAYRRACQLAEAYWDKRSDFHLEVKFGSIDETIKIARESDEKPVFISDSGDNVTAGAAGDVPLFVERLLSMKAKDAVVGGILDPEAVNLCKKSGVGSKLKVEIGGKIDRVNGIPLEVKGKVVSLSSDGAVLRIDGVDVILTTQRRPWGSLDSLRTYGVDVLNRKIVVVKLGYLSPELRRAAALALMALSPGFSNLRITQLRYEKVRRPLFPLDQDFSWKPPIYPKKPDFLNPNESKGA